jgi:hypothetical protein
MGEKYPLLSPREIIPALRKMGFEEVSHWYKPVSNSMLFSNCCRIFHRAFVRNKIRTGLTGLTR